ncbi:MAG: HAD-IA family hydrolase [Bacteroides sp.]|nr:HAD-IA family hydrolase [Bacteroides sp.]
MYDYILFDLDGTVTDPFEGITKCVVYALDSLGVKIADPKELCCFIGPPLFQQFKTFCGFDDAQAAEAVRKYRERYESIGWRECKLNEGVAELLARLKETGKKTALATSKPEKFAKLILEYFDIARYFDFIGGAELDINGRNGKKEIIEYVLSALGVTDRSRAVIVGDTLYDAEGAKAAGISCIGVLCGYGTREELREHGADPIFNNMKNIKL